MSVGAGRLAAASRRREPGREGLPPLLRASIVSFTARQWAAAWPAAWAAEKQADVRLRLNLTFAWRIFAICYLESFSSCFFFPSVRPFLRFLSEISLFTILTNCSPAQRKASFISPNIRSVFPSKIFPSSVTCNVLVSSISLWFSLIRILLQYLQSSFVLCFLVQEVQSTHIMAKYPYSCSGTNSSNGSPDNAAMFLWLKVLLWKKIGNQRKSRRSTDWNELSAYGNRVCFYKAFYRITQSNVHLNWDF